MASGSWSAETRAGILWAGAAFLFGKSLAFLSTLVLARLLTPGEFGVVAAIIVYITLIELVSDLGMQATVVYEQEEGVTDRVHTAFTINLVLVVALTGGAVLASPLAAAYFDVEQHTDLFRLASLNLLLVGLGNIPDALLLRGMDFRRRTAPLLIRGAVGGTISITLAATGLGAEALVYGLLAGSAAWTAVLWLMTPERPRLGFDAGIARSMLSYGTGSTTVDGLAIAEGRMDQAIIGPALGSGALGLYTVGLRLPDTLIGSMSAVVSNVAFPALSRQRANDRDGLAHASLTLVRYQALYSLPAAVALAVLAGPLIVVLFSSVWAAAAGVLAAMAIKNGLSAIVFPLGDALKAVGRQRMLAALSVIEVPLLLGGMLAASTDGIVLVAWVRAAVEVTNFLLITALAVHIVGVKPSGMVRALAPALVTCVGVAAGAGAVRLAWSEESVLPLVAGLAAGAAGGLLALRLVAPEQVRSLMRHLGEVNPLRRTAPPERVAEG